MLQRNASHLSMSSDTPISSGMYTEAISKDGKGSVVESILNGTFQYSGRTGDSIHDSKAMG